MVSFALLPLLFCLAVGQPKMMNTVDATADEGELSLTQPSTCHGDESSSLMLYVV